MKADYKFGNLAMFIPWFVNNDCKQEGIPVGYIQTTVVAATDVRTWEGSTYWSGVCLLGGVWLSEGLPYTPQAGPWDTPHPLPQDGPWEGSAYWSGVCLLGGVWLSEGLPYTPQDGPWDRPHPLPQDGPWDRPAPPRMDSQTQAKH